MLRYRLEGSGPPLLLIHGWGVTYTIWQNLAPLLSPHFRLIMVELPGLGGSPQVSTGQPYYSACAEALEELRHALGIEQWAVLAYSTGTRAAEAYMQRDAQAITHAIFLCPTYVQEIWSLLIGVLDTTHPVLLTQWFLSDWRLLSLVRAFGFNGKRHDYSYLWANEIRLQSVDTLVRSLCEMPGRGRAPFKIPRVPTLFIWGARDVLIAPPRPLGPNDVVIPANHSAPMLAAPYVAEVVIPFLVEGRRISIHNGRRHESQRRRRQGDLVRSNSERRLLIAFRGKQSLARRLALRRRGILQRVRKGRANAFRIPPEALSR